jgi:hypothetical protein
MGRTLEIHDGESTTHMSPILTNEIINAAITGFEAQKAGIDAQIAELRAMLDGGTQPTPAATPETHTLERRKFSAAARRRMKEAQQRRWAKIRGESEPTAPETPEAAKPKRKISAAGLKAISEATKKRWAAFHAAKRAPAAAKKPTAKRAAAKKAPVKMAKKPAAKKSKKRAAKTPEVAATRTA